MFSKGLDIVIIARVEAKKAGYQELEHAVMHLCRLHGVIPREKKWEYEEDTDLADPILPEVFIADEDNQMSVCANLFAVWIRSDTEARCNQRKYSGSLENIKM